MLEVGKAKVVQTFVGDGEHWFSVRMPDPTSGVEMVVATVKATYQYRSYKVEANALTSQGEEALAEVLPILERNVKWAELLAASNHGMDLRWATSRGELLSHWFQGIGEGMGADFNEWSWEGRAIEIMEAEIKGFLADVIGTLVLPDYWADVEQQLQRMEGVV